jgi:hypothetical protein
MSGKPRPPTDLRALQRREQRRLALWVVIFLTVGGGVAIGLVYGWGPAALGEVCLLGGVGVLGLAWLLLALLGRWAGKD